MYLVRSLLQLPKSRENRLEKSAPVTSANSLKRFSPGLESPSFDQVREEIYSEVASLISENETRLYHMLKFLRAVRSLNTDYLIQCGLSSLNRVINNYQNPDVIDFSAIAPPPPACFLPCAQMSERQQQVKERKEAFLISV
ncbi:Pericentriolar material 1 protein isoform X2 [Oopsacas minuta]|uniref:Pericentriolar material 1 protein isoform X2 n=1 Tax=Oopsacas minuta TaxID=111878 RepID=A0AAV7KDZ3_9METZ|nr:Pericentriolar material 1 protein isoform X2 [Oopsacas minuta]